MDVAENPGLLLQTMKVHEEAIAGLYKFYAEQFPEHSDFWMTLSQEEIQHAAWIKELQLRIEKGSGEVVIERFTVEAINNSIDFINNQIAEAAKPNFKLIDALSTAMDLENALIESKYFEVFEGDSECTIRTLNALTSVTREHGQRIRSMLQKQQMKIT